MAAAPQVQTLAQVMADLAPGYDEQAGVIGQQQQALTAKGAAQRQGLEAQKVEGFNLINDQATGRGASFSGIPQHEQANYLSTKYLPGVQASIADEQAGTLTLAQQLAQIRTNQRETALSRVGQQESALNQWNMQQMQIQAQAEQAAADRAFQASQAAASRSGASSDNEAAKAAAQKNMGDINGWLFQRKGGDGKVSPSNFNKGLQMWMQKGGAAEDYYAFAQRYINPKIASQYGL